MIDCAILVNYLFDKSRCYFLILSILCYCCFPPLFFGIVFDDLLYLLFDHNWFNWFLYLRVCASAILLFYLSPVGILLSLIFYFLIAISKPISIILNFLIVCRCFFLLTLKLLNLSILKPQPISSFMHILYKPWI